MMTTDNNIDHDEISKFDQIAHRWWDKDGEFKPLHDINPIRLQFIRNNCSLSEQAVLDVGCGGGILSESMAALQAKVTGIDLSESAISTAKLHLYESKLEVDYQFTSVEKLAEQSPGQFDIVTCMEMLEHVPSPLSIIKSCATLAKPGGKLFFSTLNRNPKSFVQGIVAAEYLLKLLPRGTHQYKKFIKPSELSQWCRSQGLDVKSIKGMGYHPIHKQYTLNDDVSVNYLVYCEKR